MSLMHSLALRNKLTVLGLLMQENQNRTTRNIICSFRSLSPQNSLLVPVIANSDQQPNEQIPSETESRTKSNKTISLIIEVTLKFTRISLQKITHQITVLESIKQLKATLGVTVFQVRNKLPKAVDTRQTRSSGTPSTSSRCS